MLSQLTPQAFLTQLVERFESFMSHKVVVKKSIRDMAVFRPDEHDVLTYVTHAC